METQLDLSSVAGYAAAVEWIRNNVVLRSESTNGILKLLVTLAPAGQPVTLFMGTANHYIMGFQGQDKIYLLNDPHRGEFKRLLIAGKFATAPEIDDSLRLGADHNSLRTLEERFTQSDIRAAQRLSQFSRSSSHLEQIRKPLSLLICMIAECARLKSMEYAFRGIYQSLDRPIKANEAIQSWKDAVEIVRLAANYFPGYPRAYAVEKLAKRAAELSSLWDEIKRTLDPFTNEKTAKQQVVDGIPARTRGGTPTYFERRFSDIAEELSRPTGRKLTAEDISLIMTACRNQIAVEAARDGVTNPPI